MSIKRITSIVLIAGAVALAMGIVPGSAARPQASDLSPASAAASYRLGAELLLSPSPQCDPGDQWSPAVAYNPVHREYLVAWYNHWPSGDADIYARRVSESGQVLGWFCVTSGLGPGGDGKSRIRPSVAYNAASDEYLMVWMYKASSGYEVWGRRIPWNGPGIYTEFLIFNGTNRSFWSPRVAWNSLRNEYLVIWSTYNTSLSQYTDVSGCRVSANGVVQPGAPIAITTSNQPSGADLVYSAALDGYMVVWTRNSGGATNYDIYGAFLNPDGAKITPPGEFAVYGRPGDQVDPAVTADVENRYMVVWEDYHSGNWDIYGRGFRANGSPVTEPFALAGTTDGEIWPDVAANAADQYLTVWIRLTGSGAGIVARLRDSGILAAPVNVFTASS